MRTGAAVITAMPAFTSKAARKRSSVLRATACMHAQAHEDVAHDHPNAASH